MPLIIASGDYSFQWGHDLPVMDTVFATAKAPLQVHLSYLTIDVVSRFVTTSLTSAKFAQKLRALMREGSTTGALAVAHASQ